ncbi:MAG: protein kinase [Planctomycetota bacterium]
MSELIVVRGPGKGSTVALSPERSVTIGAAIDAAIRVGGEGIAGEHVAVKALKGGGFGAKALQGEFRINGKAMAAARLSDGDLLQIGDSEIRYQESKADTGPGELGGFTLLGVLGKGGMGVVWRAEQKSLGREVALKVLTEKLTQDPVFVGRFQAEARAAARLHHPNVVQVFDVDHVDGTWFYSMELMHGGSLETRLKREGKLPSEEAVRAILDAARGLAFAEQVQIVHRDIKPDNLMVDRHGHVKLADLGLAQVEDDGDDDKLRGTPHFMSPEQVQRKPLDHRSDLYSLGCTFYRLLTGRTPFSGESVKDILRAQLGETAPWANKVEPGVPADVAAIVDRLMQKDPAARFQSADELVEALEATLAPPARKGLWIALAAVAVVAIGVAVALAMRDPEVKTIKVTNTEEAARLAEQARELEAQTARIEAEKARIAVQKSGLSGVALAEALEKMAAAHKDTPAAKEAITEASRVRQEVANATARAKERAETIARAVDALQKAVDAALQNDDPLAALGASSAPSSETSVADAEEITAARNVLQQKIATAATKTVEDLRNAITTAFAAKDPEAMQTALLRLEAVLRGDHAWPDALVPGRAELLTFLGDQQKSLVGLRAGLEAAAESQALDTLRSGLFAEGGALAAIAGFRFGSAADQFTALAASTSSPSLGKLLESLVPSLRAAESYTAALEAAAATGTHEIAVPGSSETSTLVGFVRTTPTPSLTLKTVVRTRPQQTVVEGDALRDGALHLLPEIDGAPKLARMAAISWLALAAQMRTAAAYLASIRPADDASGVAEGAFRIDPNLNACAAALAGTQEEGFVPLSTELQAAVMLGRGLQAFATRRNTTAAGLLERSFVDFGKTLVVRAQR